MQKSQTNNIALGLANCFVYEAFDKIEGKANFSLIRAFFAFELLGRVKVILGRRFEQVKSELYEKAKWEGLANGYTEDVLNLIVEIGTEIGEKRPIPAKIDFDFTDYNFFADIVMEKIGYKIRRSWLNRLEVWDGRFWKKKPKGIEITSFVYYVLRQKVAIWREALKACAPNTDFEKWMEMLQKKIRDPWWLEKIAKALLEIEYFRGIVIPQT
jgi:hypothetical protein